MPKNWEARERKRQKAKHGMKVSGKSAFLIREAQAKRDAKAVAKVRDRIRKDKGHE